MFGTQQQQTPKQFGTLFGSSTAPSGGLFGNTNQPQQSGSLFGSTQASQPQQSGSIFGSTLGAPSQQSTIFGGNLMPAPSLGSVLGSSQQQLPQLRQSTLFKPFESASSPRKPLSTVSSVVLY